MKTGIELIAEERATHPAKGWTAEHDAGHAKGEIAAAASCYAAPQPIFELIENRRGAQYTDPWPWGRVIQGRSVADADGYRFGTTEENKRGKTRLRQLQVAGALIAAEMDRLIASGNQC